ncbi:RNA-directed DNA polymerase [Pedobacter sp. GR22-10]|uniref:RNA-directed DNA polymerase n=1 Tax=Pedobacter sp. GR22-10 TaxID=2994472 RepID=UPI002245D1C0|nr:RNA-directed DNA polymerase [Pedobacter sp. GR22-10]MCX2432193.1 RNA-directed DNA polymerase [Pedobacter sp. GR22-10]
MSQATNIRDGLLRKGFFPEVLPPCFDSSNLARSFKGLVTSLDAKRFHKRSSGYIRYSGTKHDGNRRYYGTVNPVPYFYICQFIGKKWNVFTDKLDHSSFGLSTYSLGEASDDRALIIPALSEISPKMSAKIKYAPYIIKTDIAQFFPSIYTHSLSWVAHGIEASKKDTARNSQINYFNNLDSYIQQCQNGQTRGVVVGPDAFRVLAEFIACEIDKSLQEKAADYIIGGVRHVDDFYIGVRSEMDSSIVLSHLREILQNFELQINDNKTKLISGLYPTDDIWAQELRHISIDPRYYQEVTRFNYILDKAFDTSQMSGSQSPMKLVLRRLDKEKCYQDRSWPEVEPKLQRILYHFPHCLDYLCLLIAKRVAINKSIDSENWKSVIELVLDKAIGANHHHEVLWLVWLAFVCHIPLSDLLIKKLARTENSHILAILIAGNQAGYCHVKSSIKLGSRLSTDDEKWLHHLVARSTGYSGARFSGGYAEEFEHLVANRIKLIDFNKHMTVVARNEKEAISRSKYGYDSQEDSEDEDDFDLDIFGDNRW